MNVNVKSTNNGFIVVIEGSLRRNGEYIFRSIDILPMLEFIGEIINDKKVDVRER